MREGLAGLALIPTTLPMVLLAPLTGRWYDRSGGRAPMTWGFLVLALSGVLLAATVLFGQLSIGWSNDAADAASDLQADRTDKPTVSAGISARSLWAAASVALVLACVLSWSVAGPVGGSFHVLFVAMGWLYNVALSRTVWSWVPYAVGFGALPMFVYLGLGDGPGALPELRHHQRRGDLLLRARRAVADQFRCHLGEGATHRDPGTGDLGRREAEHLAGAGGNRHPPVIADRYPDREPARFGQRIAVDGVAVGRIEHQQ